VKHYKMPPKGGLRSERIDKRKSLTNEGLEETRAL